MPSAALVGNQAAAGRVVWIGVVPARDADGSEEDRRKRPGLPSLPLGGDVLQVGSAASLAAAGKVAPRGLNGEEARPHGCVPEVGPDELLLADANAIHDAAAVNATAFVAAGLPENVLPNLQAQIEAFKAAKAVIANVRNTFTATTQAARTALKGGDEANGVIDAILAHAVNADPKALTRFRAANMFNSAHCHAVVSPSSLWLSGAAWAVIVLVVGFLFFWRAEVQYGRG